MKARASNWGKAYHGRSTRKKFEVEGSVDTFDGTIATLRLKRNISNATPLEEGNDEMMTIELNQEAAMLLAVQLKNWFVHLPRCPAKDRFGDHPLSCNDCHQRRRDEYDVWERAAKKGTP